MTQIQQLGFLANNLSVNTSANTATFTNILVVGNSSVNVVVNSSSVYVSGVALGSGGTNVASQYAWTNTQSFSNTITFTGAILANTVNAASYTVGTAVSINSTSMAVNAYSIGSPNTATFYNINGQANASAGAFIGNAYATLGGASGNYLAFGQQTSSAQWIQSGYSSVGAPVYYSIILNPLGGNIGIGNTAPTDRLSVNGNTYLQGTATVTGNTTAVNVYSTGTINAASHTVGTSFIANTSQLTVTTPVSANGGVGTAGQVLTSNGATGSPYWSSVSGGGGSTSVNVAAQYAWTNTQSFSAVVTHTANVSVNGAIIANGGVGTSGQVLTSSAGGNVYWSTISGGGGGGGFTNGQSISVANLAITGALSAYGGAGSAGQVLTSNGTAVYWSTVAAGSSNTSSIVRQLFVANGTQNTFSVTSGYVPNFLDVYLNGVKLQTNLEANVQSGSTFTIIGDTPVNNAVIEVVGLVGTPTINYTKNIKTFNITGSFAAPITGVSRYVPITNTNITTIRMINSDNIVGADLIAQIYKNNVLDSSYSITSGNYTSFYSNANITLTTNDYLTINISQGIGNNFSITVSN